MPYSNWLAPSHAVDASSVERSRTNQYGNFLTEAKVVEFRQDLVNCFVEERHILEGLRVTENESKPYS